MTPEEFAQKINEWSRGTMIENHGTRFLSAGEGRACTQLAFKPTLTQTHRAFSRRRHHCAGGRNGDSGGHVGDEPDSRTAARIISPDSSALGQPDPQHRPRGANSRGGNRAPRTHDSGCGRVRRRRSRQAGRQAHGDAPRADPAIGNLTNGTGCYGTAFSFGCFLWVVGCRWDLRNSFRGLWRCLRFRCFLPLIAG